MPAGVTCAVTVAVTSLGAGSLPNSTGSITTPIQLNSSGASASFAACTYALAPLDLPGIAATGAPTTSR